MKAGTHTQRTPEELDYIRLKARDEAVRVAHQALHAWQVFALALKTPPKPGMKFAKFDQLTAEQKELFGQAQKFTTLALG